MNALAESRVQTSMYALQGASPLRKIFYGSTWYGLAVGINRLIPGLLTVILAWRLQPHELGVVSFALAYYGIFSLIADWSIAYAVQKLIPENETRAGEIAWTALFLRLGLSTLVGIFCWGLDTGTGAFHGYGLYIALLTMSSAFGTVAYVYNARCEFAKGSLFSVGFQLAWLPITLVLVKLGMPVKGPLLALCISFISIGVPAFLLNPALRRRITFLTPIAIEILRYGAWGTLATLLSGFADQIGILVVAYRLGDVPAGVFKVATTFGVVPALLGMVVVLPLMPVAKRGLLNGDDVSADLVLPILRYLLMFGLAIAATGFVLAPAIVRTFVREDYMGAIWPLRVLLGANVFRMLVTALSGILFVGQGLRALVRIHGTVAAIGLAGSLLVVQSWGVTGVALGLLAAWATGTVLMYKWFEQKSAQSLDWSTYLRYASSAAVAAICAFLATRFVGVPYLQFILGGSTAVIGYILLLWMQRDLALLGMIRMVRQRTMG